MKVNKGGLISQKLPHNSNNSDLRLMKKAFFIILLLATTHGKAQEIQKYFDFQWKECDASLARFAAIIKKTDSGWLRNDIFIATKKMQMSGLYKDSSTQIANGWFRFYYANGILKQVGKNENNKKEGLWLSYHHNGMMSDSVVYEDGYPTGIAMGWHSNGFPADSIAYGDDFDVEVYWYDDGSVSSAGRTINGKLTGVWQFFHKSGTLAAVEKYDKGKLISREYYDERGRLETDTSSKDREVGFKGGSEGWKNYISKRLYFPNDYKLTNSDIITVVVSALIDEEGNITEPFVEIPFYPKFDEIALDVFKKAPKWIPRISHNRRVKQVVRQPVSFSQE